MRNRLKVSALLSTILIVTVIYRETAALASNSETANIGELLTLANKAWNAGRTEEARSLYSRIIDLSPSNVIAFVMRGNCYKRTGDYSSAENDYGRALAIDPTNGVIYDDMATVLDAQHEFDAANKMYNQAIQFSANDVRIRFNRARFRLERGDSQGAVDDLTKALTLPQEYLSFDSLDGNDIELTAMMYKLLGDAKFNLGDYKAAETAYSQSIKIARGFQTLYLDRSKARDKLGDSAGAQEDRLEASKISEGQKRRERIGATTNP